MFLVRQSLQTQPWAVYESTARRLEFRMHFHERLYVETEIRILDDSRFERQLRIFASLPKVSQGIHANQYHLCLTYPESEVAVVGVDRAAIFEHFYHRPTQVLVFSQGENRIVTSSSCRT